KKKEEEEEIHSSSLLPHRHTSVPTIKVPSFLRRKRKRVKRKCFSLLEPLDPPFFLLL
ncbi:unnamed protein product, partial [Musa textilis]